MCSESEGKFQLPTISVLMSDGGVVLSNTGSGNMMGKVNNKKSLPEVKKLKLGSWIIKKNI